LASDLLARLQAACAHSQPVPNEFDLRVADSVQRIFILASSIRHELRLIYVEPLHLLAASLGDESSRGAQIFREAGITREAILNFIRTQSSVESAISGEEPARAAGVQVGSPDSQRARQVLFLARREAQARGAEVIEPEDVLVALVTEDQGKLQEELSRYPMASASLAHFDLRPHRPLLPEHLANNLLEGLDLLRPRSRPLAPGKDQPLAGGVKRALAVADRLRDELRRKEMEPLHLLAAILEDTSARGAQVFLQNGITAEKVIQFIREAT
jgi:ATP-dependent Clp protease ATP-binding subunit ClpA